MKQGTTSGCVCDPGDILGREERKKRMNGCHKKSDTARFVAEITQMTTTGYRDDVKSEAEM